MKNTDRVPVPPSGLIEIIGYAAFYRILCRMVFGQLSGILWSVPGIQFRLWITIHRVLFPSCRRYLVCRGPFEFDMFHLILCLQLLCRGRQIHLPEVPERTSQSWGIFMAVFGLSLSGSLSYLCVTVGCDTAVEMFLSLSVLSAVFQVNLG